MRDLFHTASGFIAGLTAALAIQLLWNWFVVPLGVETITYLHAIGLLWLIFIPLIFIAGPILTNIALEHGGYSSRLQMIITGGNIVAFGTSIIAIIIGWMIQSFI